MREPIVSIARVLDFAARKHTGKTRRGKLEEPSINHVAEVASLLAEVTKGRDPYEINVKARLLCVSA